MIQNFSNEDDFAMLRWLYYVGGYIPAIFAFLQFLCLITAMIQLGHLPVNGQDIGLNQMKIQILALPSFVLAIGTFISVLYWPFVSIHLLLNRSKISNFSYLPMFLFSIGILLYFITRFFLPAQFLWLND